MARKYCKKQSFAPGLVNAVLRNAVRNGDTLKQPDKLSVKYSHPQVLLNLLTESIGKERLEPMLQANNMTPPTVVQVNTLRITTEELVARLEQEHVTAQSHGWMRDCLVLGSTGNLEQLPAFREGLFYVQDAAAKLCVQCAGLPEGAQVLDCCAAPGGKSFAAAIAMRGTGHIHSCDVHEHKIELIRQGAGRLGLVNISAGLQDAAQLREEWVGKMDAVLADVPCSGYGIIRKKPDIRFKDPKEMEELPQLQLQILNTQAKYVKPGGVLLFSTCTLLRRENEAVAEAFLAGNPDFVTEPLELPDVFPQNETGMLTLVPGEYDTDGFFICRLRRKS